LSVDELNDRLNAQFPSPPPPLPEGKGRFEIGLITPPVGMNVYIISSLAKDVPMRTAFRGVVPFLVSDAIRVLLLVFFPALSLWLVRTMG